MAEGWLHHFAGDMVKVYSAGTLPDGVNPLAIQAMKIAGVDISHHTSNKIDDYMGINFDFVITLCDNAKDRCPYFLLLKKNYTIVSLTQRMQPELIQINLKSI